MDNQEFERRKQAKRSELIERFGLTERNLFFPEVEQRRFDDFVRRLQALEERLSVVEADATLARVRELEAENAQLKGRLHELGAAVTSEELH